MICSFFVFNVESGRNTYQQVEVGCSKDPVVEVPGDIRRQDKPDLEDLDAWHIAGSFAEDETWMILTELRSLVEP